jgi:hypothetical protein
MKTKDFEAFEILCETSVLSTIGDWLLSLFVQAESTIQAQIIRNIFMPPPFNKYQEFSLGL